MKHFVFKTWKRYFVTITQPVSPPKQKRRETTKNNDTVHLKIEDVGAYSYRNRVINLYLKILYHSRFKTYAVASR